MSEKINKNHIWKIIDKFFDRTPNFWTEPQIDSYNDVFISQLPLIIKQFNPIVLEPTIIHKDNSEKFTEKHKIKIYIGCEVNKEKKIVSSSINCMKPVLRKQEINNGTIIEKQTILYPNECRLKNLTYSSALVTNVVFEIFKIEVKDKTRTEKRKQIFEFNIIDINAVQEYLFRRNSYYVAFK